MENLKKVHIDPELPKSTFFHIGQDIRKSGSGYPNVYKSTIKKDYRAYGNIMRQSRIPSPKSAEVFSVDARINEQKSLTACHFAKHSATKRTMLSDVAKLALGTKNLTKMNVDGTVMSFDTTHQVYFPTRVLEKVKAGNDLMKSYISLGKMMSCGDRFLCYYVSNTLILCKNILITCLHGLHLDKRQWVEEHKFGYF